MKRNFAGKWLAAAVALVCMLSTSASARPKTLTVTGTVMAPSDSGNQSALGLTPCAGVSVAIQGINAIDITDVQGNFHFENVPAGEHTIVAMKTGFPPTIKKVNLEGPTQNVMITLYPSSRMGANDGTFEIVPPDTVYVAFTTPTSNSDQQPSVNQTGTVFAGSGSLPGASVKGPILYGSDPYGLGTPPPPIPGMPNASIPGQPSMPSVGAGSQQPAQVMAIDTGLLVFNPEHFSDQNYFPSPSRIYWLAFNASGTKLFAATDQNTIDVIDTMSSNHMRAQIPAGGVVNEMVRVRNLIYAAIMTGTSDAIMIIDPLIDGPSRLIQAPPLSNGARAHVWSITASADGSRVFAALGNPSNGEIVEIDTSTSHPVGYAQVGPNPMGVAITPDNRYVLAANTAMNAVTVIDALTMQPVAQIPVGISPFHIVVRPDSTKAYVSCRASNEVCVVNLKTMRAGATIPVGINPSCMAISSDGRLVYVANQGSGTVSVIDTISDTFMRSTNAQPRARPFGVVVKP